MPETTAPLVPPVTETVVVSETVTIFPPPPEAPAPAPGPLEIPPVPEPVAAPEPLIGEVQAREMLDALNTMNASLEGTGEVAGQVVLDPMQFGALGVAFAVVVGLLAFLAVLGMRR